MRNLLSNRIVQFALITTIIFSAMNGYAQPNVAAPTESIDETSVPWEDVARRTQLLEAVPTWHTNTIQSLFDAYTHPAQFYLPKLNDVKQYNALFIHAHWGPLNNNFVKYPRPTKAFAIIKPLNKAKNSSNYYMAPLIKEETSGEFYIFDNQHTHPIELSKWIDAIKLSHPDGIVYFNFCNAYANQPGEICDKASYQDEIKLMGENFKNSSAQLTNSASRSPNKDWHSYIFKMMKQTKSLDDNAVNLSKPWDDINARTELLNTVTTWPDYQTILRNFKLIRDQRYFKDENIKSFLRRITWLYPDDGCWTRTSAVIQDFFGPFNNPVNTLPRPSKIFAFGNLCVDTNNSENGRVSWWYHTVPIVRDATTNQTYVIDPAINPSQPLTVEAWMQSMASHSNKCGTNTFVEKFMVCDSYGASPFDSCLTKNNSNFVSETQTVNQQEWFREYEYKRQLLLKRDPTKVLGDSPPWLDTNTSLFTSATGSTG